tara:strand:+ start:8145 stop:8807 length:663 start_codon:yes stop_codon:yes gene_type:complete
MKLVNIYNKVLQESLMDEDYPPSFNMEEFKTIRSFNGRMKYCEQHLTRINSGSGRIVYQIDDEKVLKLAKNTKGVAQCEVEIQYGGEYLLDDVVATVFDSHPDGLWVEMELARKLKAADFTRITGYKWKVFSNGVQKYANQVNAHKNRSTFFHISDEDYEMLWDDGDFAYQIFDFIGNYDVPGGDLSRMNSYGVVKRNGQDAIVVIDYGLTHEVYDSYYS